MNDFNKGDYKLYVDPTYYFGKNTVVRADEGVLGRALMNISASYSTIYGTAGNDVISLMSGSTRLTHS